MYDENPLKAPIKFTGMHTPEESEAIIKRILGQNWEDMLRFCEHMGWGVDGMPAHEVISGQLYLFDSISPRWSEIYPKDQIACGFHGCVYETRIRGMVFKLCTDQSEARFWNVVVKDKLRAAGIPWCSAVKKLKGRAEGLKLGTGEGYFGFYALWRQDVPYTGLSKIMDAFVEEGVPQFSEQMGDLQAVLSDGLDDAKAGFEQVKRGKMSWPELVDRLNMLIQMNDTEITRKIFGTFIYLAKREIVLLDVHAYNIGYEPRDRDFLITDPGHAFFGPGRYGKNGVNYEPTPITHLG